MPRKAIQDGDWNYKVNIEQLKMPDGKSHSGVFATVRVDTNKVLGIVSEKGYGLIQNDEFITTVRQALANLGLTDYKEDIMVTDGGRNMYATYSFDNRIRPIHKVGDQVGLVLRFFNSFSGKKVDTGELMAKILRCLNGAMMDEGQFKLQQKHTPKINLGFVQDVTAKAVADFDKGLQVFAHLGGVPITDEQGINILKHMPISDSVREHIQTIWLTPNFHQSRARNLYTLYDAATEFLRDLSKDRFEMSTRTNRQILKKLVTALDPVTFAGLVVPPVIVPAPAVILTEPIAQAVLPQLAAQAVRA